MSDVAERDPRVYFAAERTFLAWIRTGLALMGIGFAVSRFGLFLRQMQAAGLGVTGRGTGISLWSGVALVAVGVGMNVGALAQHVEVVGQLRAGTWVPGRVSRNAVVLAALLAAVGVGMAVSLVLVR